MLLPTLIMRGYLFLSLEEDVLAYPSLVILRGFFSDLCAVSLLAACIAILPTLWLRALAIIIYCYFLAANYDYVHVHYANMTWELWRHGLNRVFLFGSALSEGVLTHAIFLSAVAGTVALILHKYIKIRAVHYCVVFLLAGGVVAVACWSPDKMHAGWMQQHALEANMRRDILEAISPRLENTKALPDALKVKYFSQDLSGNPITAIPVSNKPNILLIVLEGMSQSIVSMGHMPFLESLQEKSVMYPHFMNQQRMTHNGMFTLLCGKYPNVLAVESKAELATQYPLKTACLPELLTSYGYHSVYMQGANLSFMRKDMLMPIMGFEEIIGESFFQDNSVTRRSYWGIDDPSLFRKTFEKITLLEQEKAPWFLTVLNVGTHHPFAVPKHYAKTHVLPLHRAAQKYMDDALSTMFSQLEKEGILDNTLVIITSDETKAYGAPKDTIASPLYNHGLLTVILPNKMHKVHQGYFMQHDIQLSILDYLGIANRDAMGRSIFRDYKQRFRPIVYGNFSLRHACIQPDLAHLVRCPRYGACQVFALSLPGDLLGSVLTPVEKEQGENLIQESQQFIAYNDIRGTDLRDDFYIERSTEILAVPAGIFSFQHIPAEKGEKIHWRVRLRAASDNVSDVKLKVRIYTEDWHVLHKKIIPISPGEQYFHTFTLPVERRMNIINIIDVAGDIANKVTLIGASISKEKSE